MVDVVEDYFNTDNPLLLWAAQERRRIFGVFDFKLQCCGNAELIKKHFLWLN